MKKLLAILFICILYAPNAARLLMYTECTQQANSTQPCDCNYSSTPADQQANFPEKQKEIQQQTDFKYLLSGRPQLISPSVDDALTHAGCVNIIYIYAFSSSIFHPPCFRKTIV